jgi:hypothetical protein
MTAWVTGESGIVAAINPYNIVALARQHGSATGKEQNAQ